MENTNGSFELSRKVVNIKKKYLWNCLAEHCNGTLQWNFIHIFKMFDLSI